VAGFHLGQQLFHHHFIICSIVHAVTIRVSNPISRSITPIPFPTPVVTCMECDYTLKVTITHIWGLSENKGTSVSYIWPACDISMSLPYTGMLGRGEVAALVLFSGHVSKLYKGTKWLMWLKLFQVWGLSGSQTFASRRSAKRDSSQVSECLWPERFQLKGSVCGMQQI
jgi:hypothetical protein